MADGTSTECPKCGAVLANAARHTTWHESLENLLPGIETERERLTEEVRARHDGVFGA